MKRSLLAVVMAVLVISAAAAQEEHRRLSPQEMIDLLKSPRGDSDDLLGSGEPVPARGINLTVHFAYDSADIPAASMPQLDDLAQALNNKALVNDRFSIAGHTDSMGGADYNMRLSQRRAEAVRDYLVNQRLVRSDRLTAAGYGKTRLFDAKKPASPLNRRVEVMRVDR